MILFQSILFLREFLACNGCFGLFTKIKNGSLTSFWCTFSAWFFQKNVLYLILSMSKVSMLYLFPFSRCQTKYFIKFLLRQLILSKQWLKVRKRGEDGNTKIWISQERKEVLRWNKQHFFIVFEGLSFCEKIKNSGHRL